MIFVLGVICYFLTMSLIGYLASRHIKTMEDYLVAGRSLPIFLAVPTLVATFFGAGSCMGVSGTVYSQGFYGVIADPFGCSLALIIAGLFFAVPFRRLKLLTVSDLLGKAYGPLFERVSTILVLPFYIGTLASQMLAMGYVFQIVSGGTLEVGIVVGSLIVLTYTVFGGMWAVTLTDFVQLGLLTLGLLLILPISFEQVTDRETVFQSFFHEFKSIIPHQQSGFHWLAYAGRIFMTGLGAIMGQDLIQRLLASRSEAVARYSGIISAVFYFLLGLIPLFVGIAGRDIFPDLEKPEQLMPLLARQFLSPVTFTIFACGLFSAIMSTADSYLLAGTSLLTNNVILKVWTVSTEKRKISLLRYVNVFIALLAFCLALSGQSIFDMMVHSGATLFVAIFVPASFALFWKATSQAAAWSGMIGGIAGWVGFIIYQYADMTPDNYEDILFSASALGGVLSLVSYVVAAWLNKFVKNRQELTLCNS